MGIYPYNSFPKVSNTRSDKELIVYTDGYFRTLNSDSDFSAQSHQLRRDLNCNSRSFSMYENKKSNIKPFREVKSNEKK